MDRNAIIEECAQAAERADLLRAVHSRHLATGIRVRTLIASEIRAIKAESGSTISIGAGSEATGANTLPSPGPGSVGDMRERAARLAERLRQLAQVHLTDANMCDPRFAQFLRSQAADLDAAADMLTALPLPVPSGEARERGVPRPTKWPDASFQYVGSDRRRLQNARRRVQRARDFPQHTCPSSRHLQMIADSLAECSPYWQLLEEPQHVAETMYAVLESLWKLRKVRTKAEMGASRQRRATAKSSPPRKDRP